MAYVKLDCGMLNSTLWVDREARELFITALLLASPREFTEPVPQLRVDSMEQTGWGAPPGWYGFVPAAGIGIIRHCGISDTESGMKALARMGEPEPDSRSQAHEGRRLIRIDGGYIVLNYMNYRDKDHTAAARQRRYRERNKLRRDDTQQGRNITHSIKHIAEAEAEAESQNPVSEPKGSSTSNKNTVPEKQNTSPEDNSSSAHGTRLPKNWQLPDDWLAWSADQFPAWSASHILGVAERFRDYWHGVPGTKGRKANWEATWRNWCRRDDESTSRPGHESRGDAAVREFLQRGESILPPPPGGST